MFHTIPAAGGGSAAALPIGAGSPKDVNGHFFTIPGCTWGGGDGYYLDLPANTTTYGRIIIAEEADVLAAGVWSNGAGGGDLILGLYEANRWWQPGDLVSEIGTVSIATSGQKLATPAGALTLAPGRYMTAMHSKTSGGQVWAYPATPVSGVAISIGGPDGANMFRANQTVTALPSTGAAAVGSYGWGPTHEVNPMFLRLD